MSFVEEEGNLFEGFTVFVSPSAKIKGEKTALEVKKMIASEGGLVVLNTNKRVKYFVCGDPEGVDEDEMKLAEEHDMTVINVKYFIEAVKRQTRLKPATYTYSMKDWKKAQQATNKRRRPENKEEWEGEENEGQPASKKKKSEVKQVLKKGSVPVDPECLQMVKTTHVLEEKGCAWSCMLNQTNIKNNNNKFYTAQILEADKKGKWWLWTRWGRVGNRGQSKLEECSNAKARFCKKFTEKTGNSWENRTNFKTYSNKYTIISIDYGSEEEDDTKKDKEDGESDEVPDSELDPQVQNFIKLICNTDSQKQAMIEMKFDLKKMPLGKVKTVTLERASAVLQKIEEVLDSVPQKQHKLINLSNQFYTLIPHYFGMSTPPIINTDKMVRKKQKMLEELGFMTIASKIMQSSGKDKSKNPIDSQYEKLNIEIISVKKSEKIYEQICSNVKTTHGPTHTDYTLKIKSIFKIVKKGEQEAFNKNFEDLHNQKLLWHGSRITNWVGILSQGLKIAPPEAPKTGYMFGKGLYFADVCTKSTNYCHASVAQPEGCALLCQVALGDEYQLTEAEFVKSLKSGYHSCKGKNIPSDETNTLAGTDVVIPMGPVIDTKQKSDLLYNEYIVYDTEQCVMQYLVQFEFDFKRGPALQDVEGME